MKKVVHFHVLLTTMKRNTETSKDRLQAAAAKLKKIVAEPEKEKEPMDEKQKRPEPEKAQENLKDPEEVEDIPPTSEKRGRGRPPTTSESDTDSDAADARATIQAEDTAQQARSAA